MIKKMLAMLAVVSCAFGAWATHISGTDFALLDEGPFVTGKTDAGASAESTYWYSGNTNDFDGTIIEGTITNVSHKILDFESNITNPVYRTILGCYGATAPSGFTPTNINSVLFVDTFVAFTPYLVNENHPAPTKLTNEDKILVWVRETDSGSEETANATNLIVTAGYLDVNGDPTPTNYVVNLTGSGQTVPDLCNGLHRLTIKAFKSITTVNDSTAGFVIYVDEYPVECVGDVFADGCRFAGNNLVATPKKYSDLDQLFPSMMPYNASTPANQLSAIGYAGVGQIGEVWYDDYKTDYPRFAGDNEQDFTVTFGDDVESFIYKDVTYTSSTNLTAGSSETSVIISNVVYASGWKHADGMWRNGSAVVSNQVGTVGDYGTFNFADGSEFILAGFQSNYMVFDGVKTNEYQTLYGPGGALAAALSNGNLILNNDIVISEGTGDYAGCFMIEEGELTIDLNGHTMKGTGVATIINLLGTLTITDSSAGKTGKVLNAVAGATSLYLAGGTTTLNAGMYEFIYVDAGALAINGGTYLDADASYPTFYLQSYVAAGKSVDWNQDPVSSAWYAIVGGSAPTTYAVTFSTNNYTVVEYTTNIAAGATLPVDAIPAFTGGTWDLDPTNAVINAATNFNYTIVASYTLTYATEYGAVPDGVVYTASTPDFALAAAPVTEVVGIQFAGWVIGSVTNAAGATYVVADHLENTTATAAWAPVVPTGTVIYLTMGSGVDSLSTSFNGTDWTAYTDPLQDVELGSTLYIKGTSSVTGYDVPQFSIVVDNTHATEQTALVVNKSAIVYFPQTAIEQEWADRNGTAAKPFVIRNYADLVALKNGVANGTITNQCFEQVANIDMDGQAAWPGIGTSGATTPRTIGAGAFEGSYDGGNHVISNVTFASATYAGLFNSAVGAVIKNLTVNVAGIETDAAEYGAGAFVGCAVNSFFTNLVATGTIGTESVNANHSTAGLFVRLEGSVVYACTNRCEIWCSKNKVGGIAAVGQSASRDYLTLCSNEGTIHATKTGSLGDGGIGGLFGWQGYSSDQPVTYTDCRSIAPIYTTASNKIGSFVGERRGGAATLSGTNITLDGMRVVYSHQDNVTYGKSIGGGLVELCTQAAFETNNTYSTMWSDLTPTFAFEAAGTISFNTNLFQATTFVITCPEGYDVEDSEAGGIVTFTCAIPTPTDPWEPEGGDHSDTAVSNKVIEVFGEAVAEKIHTYDTYTNMVAYLEGKGVTDPDTLNTTYASEKPYVYQSYMLGATVLFTEDPVISITSVAAGSEAGEWEFTVVVTTETDSPTALQVAADKVKALVKVRNSLTTGSWAPPASVDAVQLLGGNAIKVTVDYGEAGSGFMKISD